MRPPFTTEQFLDVIARYNAAIGPMPMVFYIMGALLVFWSFRRSRGSDRWISGLLAFLWAWMGVVYHWVFFTDINPAAWLFGGIFVLQAATFVADGVLGDRLAYRFEADGYGLTGAALLFYALIVYPLLGALAGHGYPAGPSFGLPCPSTIATFGILLWATRPVPIRVVLIPLVWSVIGASAALQFGIPEDYGLLLAGVGGTALVLTKNRRLRTGTNPETAPV